MTKPRDRRAGEADPALPVLTGARDHLNVERLRCINALTALVRGHDLGIDARRALTTEQISTIADWRRREEDLGAATARAEAVRLAKRVLVLDVELAENRTEMTSLVAAQAPELLELPGVGADTAAVILTVWSHPRRIRSEAAFAKIAGTSPIPASSGSTLCGTGSTAAGTAGSTGRSTRSCLPGCAPTQKPGPTSTGASPRARRTRRSGAASSAMSGGRSSGPWLPPTQYLECSRQRLDTNRSASRTLLEALVCHTGPSRRDVDGVGDRHPAGPDLVMSRNTRPSWRTSTRERSAATSRNRPITAGSTE